MTLGSRYEKRVLPSPTWGTLGKVEGGNGVEIYSDVLPWFPQVTIVLG